MKFSARAISLVLALLLATAACAQPYPSKPIRLVVPFPPGGINDVLARIVGQKLSEDLQQGVVIENRPGAGGTIGTNAVAKAAPDGYTLLFGATSTVAITPSLYAILPYDAINDFAPIVQIASVASILVVNPSLPANSLQQLLELARAKPGQLNFGSAGSGASQHLGGELLKLLGGVSMVHVPYKGGAPAMTDLVAGQIALMVEPLPTALPQIKAGKVRALAVSTSRRSPVLPELPTMAEAGLAGYDLTIWFGLLAPAATPRDVIDKLNAATVKVLRSAEMRERLAGQGAEPIGDSPEQFGAHIREEIARWAKVIRAAAVKVD